MQTSTKERGVQPRILVNPGVNYITWYDYKKDLESLYGRPLLNDLWLKIKPQTALPWSTANLFSSYLSIESLK
jgi:hypothetical protein